MNTRRNDFVRTFYDILFAVKCFCLSSQLFLVGCDGQVDGDLRLLNGSTYREGRVEIYYDGYWGTICDDYWDDADATVVCRQLKLAEFGEAIEKQKIPKGTGKIMLDDVDCTGQEEFLVNCSSRPWREHDCRHTEDAGVRCRDILFCRSEPCLNGGTCRETAKGYRCSCPENFDGYVCQWERPSENQSTTTTHRAKLYTVDLNIHSRTQTGSTHGERLRDTGNSLYFILSQYVIDVVLSVALFCTIIAMFCLICWTRRKFARLRNWERRDSFSSDNEIALTMEGHLSEHNMNEYNVQRQQQQGEEDCESDYVTPKTKEEGDNGSMEEIYENAATLN